MCHFYHRNTSTGWKSVPGMSAGGPLDQLGNDQFPTIASSPSSILPIVTAAETAQAQADNFKVQL
jgi:hypothetical protein